ncbi:MAG: endonuclease dU [Promethearchaeota archaeon]
MAFDDAPHLKSDLAHFNQKSDDIHKVSLIGVVCRGIQLLNVSIGSIHVDGLDSTQEILKMYKENPYNNEIRLIMIDSPTLGGFNTPNPFEIHEKTQIPIILLPDRKPKTKINEIYGNIFPERYEQIEMLKKLPELESLTVSINQDPKISREIFFHAIGITKSEIIDLLNYLSEFSAIPEPLRLAHIVASSYASSKHS